MNIVLIAVAAVIMFGILIFVHELGHFITAKKAGITVHEFAIGMGPTIIKFTKGETTYAIRLLPIGGFVQMEGEDEESDDPRSFQKASMPKRMLVIVAGATLNLLAGFLILVIFFSVNGRIASRTIAAFTENASTQESGLQVGDTIVEVNGRKCFVLNDVFYEFTRTENGVMDLVVVRDDKKVELKDIVFTMEEIVNEKTGEITKGLGQDFYVLGIEPTFTSVVGEAFNTSISFARTIYLNVFDMITGKVSISELSGPVGIAQAVGEIATSSPKLGDALKMLALFMAMISINLGVANMLPIPGLDGGRFLFLLVELVRRKPINPKYEIYINIAGVGLVLLLMLVVSFNDIAKIFF